MTYWFLYNLTSGVITQAYQGNTDEWDNIPNGCGVIGPVVQTDLVAQDAFVYPDLYTVVSNSLTKVTNYSTLKAHKQADAQKSASMPSNDSRLASLESAILSLMGL